ncbi:3-methyl-2-oxobutanoate hydroxymethyltransferase [Marinomonas agarivorans]|nr:3-methyl-2-oxobutanoate hydroxymethyltransferase [Marinomonas agarivorans]
MYTNNSQNKIARPITISRLQQMKEQGEKFACLTSYDATFTNAISHSGVEVILVGDSLGMVIQGQDSTLPVSIEDMCYHVAAVKRGNAHSFLMADMPFMSYSKPEQALDNAAKLMQAGAQMVKLEGGQWLHDTISLLSQRGIPVCAHLGLTPQAVHKLGGYKVQGRDEHIAKSIETESLNLVEAGADMLLYECIPTSLAKRITEQVSVPTIGIGAGPHTDGQILVLHDMLGVNLGKPARFVKNYLTEGRSIQAAFEAYVTEVKQQAFPTTDHSFE